MKPEEEFRNYPMMLYKLKNNDENLYDYIISKYKPLIDDKKSVFRLECDTLYTWKYSEAPTEVILSYTFKKVNNIVGIDKLSLAKETAKNPNKIKLFIASNGFIFCGSHLLHNSLSMFDLTKQIITPTGI
jgi:hypothetical protein